MWVPSFDCVSYVNVYVVLVCGHLCVSAWLLLDVCGLVDAQDSVIMLFQSGVAEYILVNSGWGGSYCAYLQHIFVYAKKTASRGRE